MMLAEKEGSAEHFFPLVKRCLNKSQYCIRIGDYANIDMEQKIGAKISWVSRMGFLNTFAIDLLKLFFSSQP